MYYLRFRVDNTIGSLYDRNEGYEVVGGTEVSADEGYDQTVRSFRLNGDQVVTVVEAHCNRHDSSGIGGFARNCSAESTGSFSVKFSSQGYVLGPENEDGTQERREYDDTELLVAEEEVEVQPA